MSSLEVLRSAGYVTVPWKNGGGVTQEVARSPGDGDFDWRVSIADVGADGPFSVFPGIDRILTLIEPAGVTLTVDGDEYEVGYLEPFSFPGDVETAGRLVAGPTRDLNLMTSRATTQGRVDIVQTGSTTLTAGEGETVLAVVITGTATVTAPSGPADLGRLDAVRLDGDGSCSLAPDGAVAVIRVVVQ